MCNTKNRTVTTTLLTPRLVHFFFLGCTCKFNARKHQSRDSGTVSFLTVYPLVPFYCVLALSLIPFFPFMAAAECTYKGPPRRPPLSLSVLNQGSGLTGSTILPFSVSPFFLSTRCCWSWLVSSWQSVAPSECGSPSLGQHMLQTADEGLIGLVFLLKPRMVPADCRDVHVLSCLFQAFVSVLV